MCEGTPDDIIVRQKLIDSIGENIQKQYELYINTNVNDILKNRFWILNLIVDAIFSCCGYIHQIQVPAMFYNLMCTWNKQNGDGFKRFYGVNAEHRIIKRSYGNVCIISNKNKTDSDKWLNNILLKLQKEYAIKFCNLLIECCNNKADCTPPKPKEDTSGVANENANVITHKSHKNFVLLAIILALLVGCIVIFINYQLKSSQLEQSRDIIDDLTSQKDNTEQQYNELLKEYEQLERKYNNLKDNYDELQSDNGGDELLSTTD